MSHSANIDISMLRTAADIDAQTEATAQQQALDYLNQTDWFVVRQTETGQDVPQQVAKKRAEARARLGSVRKP